MRFQIIFVVLLSAFSASAQTIMSPPSSGMISFSQLKSHWDKGAAVSTATLVGKWKKIARAYRPGCNYDGAFDREGIRNQDGSVQGIEFSSVLVSLPGFPEERSLGARILNDQIGHHFSPYVGQEKEPQFSAWHHRYGWAYYVYYCRQVVGTTVVQLACAQRLAARENSTVFLEDKECMGPNFSHIDIFIKE